MTGGMHEGRVVGTLVLHPVELDLILKFIFRFVRRIYQHCMGAVLIHVLHIDLRDPMFAFLWTVLLCELPTCNANIHGLTFT